MQEINIESIRIAAEEEALDIRPPSGEATDVIVTCDDGSRWVATFHVHGNQPSTTNPLFSDDNPAACAKASDMIVADEVRRARIEELVWFLAERDPQEFRKLFTRIDNDA